MGIAKKDQDKLFKLFGFVQDSQNLNKNGIGLGLVISDEIAQKFGGEISFKSKLGEGSTFKFTFLINEIQHVEQINDQIEENR